MSEHAFPPAVKYIWVCPVCQSVIVGTYNIDPMREKCSKTWHKGMAERVEYVWSRLAVDAVAQAMRNGQPDDGSDADEATRDDALLALAALIDARERPSEQRSDTPASAPLGETRNTTGDLQ